MPFGGLSPLPLRLGASSDVSISPENWLRLCDDVVATRSPLAVLYIQEPAGVYGACTVSGLSRAGTDPRFIPATSSLVSYGGGHTFRQIEIDLGEGYTDSTFGDLRKWKPRSAIVGCSTTVSVCRLSISGNKVYLRFATMPVAQQSYYAVIYGETEQRWSGDYGASPYKKAAKYAGATPYAAIWLTEMMKARGDAFSTATGSYTQMENIALARSFAYLQNISERHAACQLPMQADQIIGRWARVLDIGTNDDRDWQVRNKCAAKYSLTLGGVSNESLDQSATLLFGSNFTGVTWGGPSESSTDYNPGGLPNGTFWPVFEMDGPGSLNIDDAAWSSPIYHFVVDLTAANTTEAARLYAIATRDFDEILRPSLPPVVTWDYRFNHDSGFNLGVDHLNRDAL